MSDAAPAPSFSDWIAGAVRLVRDRMFRHPGTAPLTHALIPPVMNLFGRRLRRFEALVALFRAGKLPLASRPRRPQEQGTAETAADPKPRLRLPARRGWLLDWLPHGRLDVAGCAWTIGQAIERDGEMRDFLAVCPQAARVLRPIWRAVSIDPEPALLRLPPRPRRKRTPRPSPAARKSGGEGVRVRRSTTSTPPPPLPARGERAGVRGAETTPPTPADTERRQHLARTVFRVFAR